jgi:glycosyltransferase involved in cell wall biosynthesis
MRLLIVSTAPFIYKDNCVYAYSPYVQELIVWNKYVDEMAFCCPIWKDEKDLLVHPIPFKINRHFKLRDIDLNSSLNILYAFFYSFHSVFILFKAILWADHIHLRCPGNVGLLGCFIQILFPNKIKTAKYAGNWDPQSKQPWSYQLQKSILSNTFLTKNMQVLVYGEWERMTKNIKPFFTATYCEEEKTPLVSKDLYGTIDFIFVGGLVKGKNPLYAVQLVEALFIKGHSVTLRLFGEGTERKIVENYILENNLEEIISLLGNQTKETVKMAYKSSHFVILPSESEGWPKALAEGMFWGCVPIATSVSCVPFMLDYGKRGLLLTMNLEKDAKQLVDLVQCQRIYDDKQSKALSWSRIYTVDVFEKEVEKLLNNSNLG